MHTDTNVSRLKFKDRTLAYAHCPANGGVPTVVFFAGFRSHMRGEKANHLSQWCVDNRVGFLRFDYSGHGESSGQFADGTLGDWADDAAAIIDHCVAGPMVLVGSSMGAWIAVLVALEKASRVQGLLGIAAAPDFSEDLIPRRLGDQAMAQLQRDGRIERPSAYSDQPDVLTLRFLEEARVHLVLRAPIALSCSLRLVHGLADIDVPWQQSHRLLESWSGNDAQLVLIKDGDHRLSRPQDLDTISEILAGLI